MRRSLLSGKEGVFLSKLIAFFLVIFCPDCLYVFQKRHGDFTLFLWERGWDVQNKTRDAKSGLGNVNLLITVMNIHQYAFIFDKLWSGHMRRRQ